MESNENRSSPKIPKGTRDISDEQMMIRERVNSIIRKFFEIHFAIAPLRTPSLESRVTPTGIYGEDSAFYNLPAEDGDVLSLRYDLTVSFARFMATKRLTSFKGFQIDKVHRRDKPFEGKYHEFYQCNFDVAAQSEDEDDDMCESADFEAVDTLIKLLNTLDIGDYEVKVNHRMLLEGMLEVYGVPPEKFRTICSSIDKLDGQSVEQVKKEMVEEKGLSVETADNICTFVKETGKPKELLSKLKLMGSKCLENASSKRALDELETLFNSLEDPDSIGRVVFDLSLARFQDYHTGLIFVSVLKGTTTQVGSIASGGRYDNLIGTFGEEQVPAVGFTLEIESVYAIIEQQYKDKNQTIQHYQPQVLVSILVDGSEPSLALILARQLWKEKIKAENMTSMSYSEHIDFAKEFGIPWVVLVGDKELEKGTVKIKNMETNVEEEVPRSDFVAEVKKRLSI